MNTVWTTARPTRKLSYRDDVGLPLLRSVTTPSSSDIDWPSTRTLSSSLPYNQHQRPLSNGRIPSANASLQHATALLGATGNGARRIRERVETTSSFHPKVVHRLNESTTWIWTINKKLQIISLCYGTECTWLGATKGPAAHSRLRLEA